MLCEGRRVWGGPRHPHPATQGKYSPSSTSSDHTTQVGLGKVVWRQADSSCGCQMGAVTVQHPADHQALAVPQQALPQLQSRAMES